MIHELIEKTECVIDDDLVEKDEFDYSKIIVKKPWGYEYLVFENEFVAIWMLHIVRKRKTSMHYHPQKRTSLILLSGQAKFYYQEGEIELKVMDAVVIGKGVFHQTEAYSDLSVDPQSENGIWVMEIESPPSKNDLVRMKDAYGRVGKTYEGSDHMVSDSKNLLSFQGNELENGVQKKFFNNCFTIVKGNFVDRSFQPDTVVTVISNDKKDKPENPYLLAGRMSKIDEFRDKTKGEDISSYTFLILEKELKTVRVADYIFSAIADLGIKQVFSVSGGGAMHLVDALGKSERLDYIATHHEQAAAMAAEGYARISGTPGAALVTSGPGGTNTITGVCGAWVDSIPAIFVSGQVKTNMLLKDSGLRQLGIQESDIVSLVKSVTKYAVTVTDPSSIRYHVEKAIHCATTGRPGPVWLDIPLDVQSQLINPDELESFTPEEEKKRAYEEDLKAKVSECICSLKKAKRPVLISGYGIRLAKGEKEFRRLVEKLNIPLISSWTTSDLIPTDDEVYIGRSGIMGDRAGNFTVQNADLLLIIGSRMSIPQVGYNASVFAREAKRIVVDIDATEFRKTSFRPDLPIQADAKEFMKELLQQLDEGDVTIEAADWRQRCRQWKAKYPVVLPEYKELQEGVNSFYFIDVLSKKLDKDSVVVTDMGTSITCTMQTFHVKEGQRLFTSSGHASMGFGLPGAIGACFANDKRKTICISGDGALQMNIQELQTVVHYQLPIILFVLNNQGYLTVKLMQQNHFGQYVGSDPSSGVSCPDIIKIARAYGIKAVRIDDQKQLNAKIDGVLAEPGPFVCEIMMPEDQPLIPRISSLKKPDGTIIAKPLEDLYPFLDRKEFLENMIVKPTEPLK